MTGFVYVLALFTVAGAPPVDLGRYDTAVECDLQARSVRVQQAGARLRCVRAPASAPWQAAGAAAQRSPGSLLVSNWVEVLP